jgi:hypothetical protein
MHMAEALQGGQALSNPPLVGAAQVAKETEVRQSANGMRFATYGETGVAPVDIDRMVEAVPKAITAAIEANTYYFVPAAMREPKAESLPDAQKDTPAMVASAWSDELSEKAICHRNVELGSGRHGVFISTRLLADRFALSFEFFINVAHAFVDKAGVPESFSDLVWKQAVDGVRGETSLDAWESRNLAFGRPAGAMPPEAPRRTRSYAAVARSIAAASAPGREAVDEKERNSYLSAAFTDAIAVYLLSLAMDFNYSDLRERDYPLLAPVALAARLRTVAALFPANAGYAFEVKYRKRA